MNLKINEVQAIAISAALRAYVQSLSAQIDYNAKNPSPAEEWFSEAEDAERLHLQRMLSASIGALENLEYPEEDT